jgi:hypothetical protein
VPDNRANKDASRLGVIMSGRGRYKRNRVPFNVVALIVVGLLTSGQTAGAATATISGAVLEKGSNRAIADAVVFLADDDRVSTSSDEAGRFDLDVAGPGAYKLGVVAVGYLRPEPIEVVVPADADSAEVTLYLDAVDASPDIIVYRERSPSRVSKTVITGETLRTIPGSGSDPLKGLQAFPGVVTGNDASSEPAIRGSRPEDNLYYVDDQPVGYMFHLGGIVSVFNGDLVDNFNLYAAAFGPEYGNATGAVIDVALRNPRTDIYRRKVNISLIGADAMIEGPVTENQSFFFSARRSYFDFVIDQVSNDEGGITIEVPYYWDYQGKYVWKLGSNNVVTGHMNGAKDEIEFKITDDGDIAERNPDLVGSSSASQSYHSQAVTLDTQRGDNADNRLSIGHIVETEDSNVGSAADVYFTTDNLYIRDKYTVRPSPRHEVMVGTGYSRFDVKLDVDAKNPTCSEFDTECDPYTATRQQSDDDFVVNFWELYARDRWRVVDDVTLVGGLRSSHEDYLDELFTEPRLGIEWDVGARTLITAGWGRYHKFPRGEQVVKKFGNPDLRNTRAEHSVVGVEQAVDAWSWKVEAYYKDYDRLVLADPQLNYRNGGSGHAYGIEALIKKAEAGPWSGWAALTLSRSVRRNDGTGESFAMDYDQPVNFVSVVSYRPNTRWQFGAKWTYHSGSPYTPVIGNSERYPDGRVKPTYGEVNSRRLPAYHRLDLRVDRRVVRDTRVTSFYFEVINAYNRKNVSGYRYDPDYTERETVYQLPLIPSFGVQVEF